MITFQDDDVYHDHRTSNKKHYSHEDIWNVFVSKPNMMHNAIVAHAICVRTILKAINCSLLSLQHTQEAHKQRKSSWTKFKFMALRKLICRFYRVYQKAHQASSSSWYGNCTILQHVCTLEGLGKVSEKRVYGVLVYRTNLESLRIIPWYPSAHSSSFTCLQSSLWKFDIDDRRS